MLVRHDKGGYMAFERRTIESDTDVAQKGAALAEKRDAPMDDGHAASTTTESGGSCELACAAQPEDCVRFSDAGSSLDSARECATLIPAQRPCVLVVHASVGSGHRSAAIAVAEALERLIVEGDERIPSDAEVKVLDILDFGRIKFDGDKTASAFTGPTRPIYDITWRFTLTGRLLWGGGTSWARIMFKKFTDYVEERKPLAVVCTHITAANAAVGARMLTGQAFPIVCVPTDYEIEGWWPHKECDLFCVATEGMAETLRPRHVPERKMLITGIPVRGVAEAEHDKDAVRDSLGLPKDKTVVLVMAGAHLPQPYVRFRATMDQTLPYLKGLSDMHFVFLPGRDEEYALHLRRTKEDMALDNMTVMGYVDDMPALMAASDLAICKSGGLTVTECLCARLPMVLLGRSYGQEKVNTALLTSLGASMHATTPRELLGTLRHLHAYPSSIKAMLVNGEALRRPNAAHDVALATLDLVPRDCSSKRHFAEFYWGGKPAHAR